MHRQTQIAAEKAASHVKMCKNDEILLQNVKIYADNHKNVARYRFTPTGRTPVVIHPTRCAHFLRVNRHHET
jgi:hypothetical protein